MSAAGNAAADITADVAIIGGGLAGLSLALALPKNFRVAIFVKRKLGEAAASGWAQGGIAAEMEQPNSPPEQNFQSHITDTLTAGAGLCNPAAVDNIVRNAPAAVQFLADNGVQFDRDKTGAYALLREGGHSRRRVLHIGDRSGAAILAALRARVLARENIQIYEHYIAVDLVVRDKKCNGFYALDLRGGAGVRAVAAGEVALASGGAGRVYLYSSTPEDATGDGIAMAYRAGCEISNMEFVQFHPTCLFHPQTPTLLISETLRGEGARLANAAGEFFAAGLAGGGDLAPRDMVARAIDAELKKSGEDCVYLDCRAKPPEFWQKKFPATVAACEARGIFPPGERIPVVPAAHYGCGGVRTDLRGRTGVANLSAIGEAADTGLHGANRLASNSLLECAVMAQNCAAAIAEKHAAAAPPAAQPVAAWDERRISPPPEAVMVAHNWEELRRIMWNYVGIARSDERLARARRRVEWIGGEIAEHYRRYVVSRDFLELRNLAQCAELVIEGALSRRESRGLHYNLDCPKTAETATPTILTRKDFARRRNAVNTRCPFSRRLITANSVTTYRNKEVGFCNPTCRNTFAAAVQNDFNNAGDAVLKARAELDALIG